MSGMVLPTTKISLEISPSLHKSAQSASIKAKLRNNLVVQERCHKHDYCFVSGLNESFRADIQALRPSSPQQQLDWPIFMKLSTSLNVTLSIHKQRKAFWLNHTLLSPNPPSIKKLSPDELQD